VEGERHLAVLRRGVVVPVQAPDHDRVVGDEPLRVDRPVPALRLREPCRQRQVLALGDRV
jgi:hypothetical protein